MRKQTYTSFHELPLVLTVGELAAVLGVGRNTAYELVGTGEIRSIRVGRQIRISKEELKRYFDRVNDG